MEFNMQNFKFYVLPPFGEFSIRTSCPVSTGTPDLWHLAYDPQVSLGGTLSYYAIQFPKLADHLKSFHCEKKGKTVLHAFNPN